MLGAFSLVPLAVGTAGVEEVAQVLERLWGGPETLVVISTDLSHYHAYEEARRIDAGTVARIAAFATDLDHEEACGATPLNGLLAVARRKGLSLRLLGACNSGDTAGGGRHASFARARGDRALLHGLAALAAPRAVAAAGRRDLHHPDQGRRAARLHRQPRGGAPACAGRGGERPRRGAPRSALPAARHRGVGALQRRGVAALRAEADPLRRRRGSSAAGVRRQGRHHPRARRPPRHVPAAGLGVLARQAAFLQSAPRQGGIAGHAPGRLPGLALSRGEVEAMTHPGRWWHRLGDGRIQCDLCPRDCKLHEGQRGLCFVRKMHDGEMVLTTYGRSSGFCIDPIEKKPLNHFYPGTSILSFGTAGCNLACKFCQNWDISKSREMDRLQDEASPEAIAHAAVRLGCKSVAFTYNDPVIFAEYAMDIADACHAKGVQAVAVTAGYIHAAPRREFYAKMDAANVDLKGFTDDFYHRICGGHLQPVLDTLVYLVKETGVWTEITTLLIPGKND